MRWFLDMCIILYYIGEGDKQYLIQKSKDFVNKKGEDSFLLCYYIKDSNLPKWLERQRILFRELLKQIKDNTYVPYNSDESKILYDRDKNKITKLLVFFRNTHDKKEIFTKLEKINQEIEIRINLFIETYIDNIVIPISDIDFKLKSCLFTWLTPNDSDAKTIASAIQEHNKKELKIITADKKDWNKELLEEVHNNIQLKKKYPKLPEIKYLQSI